MARARNIKPGFFTNPELIECHPLARLLFIGLWTIADREGRLRDRPAYIKLTVLPGDNCNTDELLEQLHSRNFLSRYVHGGKHYIQITNFLKHQNPHRNEQPSEIPELSPLLECSSNYSTTPASSLNPSSLNDESRREDAPTAPVSKYAFDGEVVRITHDQQTKWQTTFTCINVIEHLKGIDAAYAKEKAAGKDVSYWFPRCAQALAKANSEALSRKGGYDV